MSMPATIILIYITTSEINRKLQESFIIIRKKHYNQETLLKMMFMNMHSLL